MNKLFKQQNSAGFTLIELMLAMSLFTFVMIIATVGFVGINRTFTKGVARKQLSESVQRLIDDITTSINNGGKFTQNNEEISKGKLCNTSVCYIWTPYDKARPSDTEGLYKVSSGNVSVDGAKKTYLVDSRYKVDYLQVDPLDTNLYRVTGIIRSADETAFNFPTGENANKYPAENQDITCKGSAQEGASTSCALEKFSFVIRVGAGR